MQSHADRYLDNIAKLPDPMAALEEDLAQCGTIELAALRYDYEGFWARPKQLPPEHRWTSWGMLTGRGWGKTWSIANAITRSIQAGRSGRLGLVAQNEDSCVDVLVKGESGLLAVSPPWFRARYELGRVVWPNGAQAFVYTPERPDAMFGPEHDTLWLSEIHGWPRATMLKAYSNLRMGLRLGAALTFWDSNPRRKHPIIKMLLERSELNPLKHVVVRGSTFENSTNLNADAIAEWQEQYGGTMVGREMLLGEQLDDDDRALFRQEWIDRSRRELPQKLQRKILVVDPAISSRKGTDATGIMEMGQGVDEQIYGIEDLTGKHSWEQWATIVLNRYMRDQCDCVIVERNRGGDACAANLRAVGAQMGLNIVKVDNDAMTRFVSGTVYVKEVIGRVSKESRAEPVASLFEKGRISLVSSACFEDLEEQLTTYEDAPGAVSPNNYDAFVWGVWELAALAKVGTNTKAFAGLDQANRILTTPQRPSISALLANAGRGRTI